MAGVDCEGGSLDSPIAVGAMCGAMERHEGGCAKEGDSGASKHGGVVIFAEEGEECTVGGMSCIC